MLSGSKTKTGLQTLFGDGTAALHEASIQQVQKQILTHATAVAGTVDAIQITMTPASTTWTLNEVVRWKSGGANAITAPTISKDAGASTKTIKKGASAALAVGDLGASGVENEGIYNGTDVILKSPPATSVTAATSAEYLAGTDNAKFVTSADAYAQWGKGADIAGAGTITFGDGGVFDITGSGWTCTDFDFTTSPAGRPAKCRATGTGTITHNATSLICPTSANIAVAAGDTWEVIQITGDNVYINNYLRANGTALVSGGATQSTEVATTSGTSIDFTGIPATAKRITVMFDEVSTNGTSDIIIQIGDSGGIETSGYISTAARLNAAGTVMASSTAGFIAENDVAAVQLASGSMVLTLQDASNTWTMTCTVKVTTTQMNVSSGTKQLSATLDRIRLTTAGGANTFDAGSVNILYE
jgi:hypothetical protein